MSLDKTIEEIREVNKSLTCTQCGRLEDLYCNIVYSQGNRVCLSCKEDNKESDKRAFDRDMRHR